MSSTIRFYAPETGDDYEDRRDARVRVLDFDEVTLSSRVEFPDGFRRPGLPHRLPGGVTMEPTSRAAKQYAAHARRFTVGRCSCIGCTSYRERFPQYDPDPLRTAADREQMERAGRYLSKEREGR